MSKTIINYQLPDPVPTISDNITLLIDEKINEHNFDYFIEYGAGSSTRYFLKKLYKANKKVTYISMEYNYKWFLHTVEAIKSDFSPTINEYSQLKLNPWSYGKCKKYVKGNNSSDLQIPENLERLPKGRKKMMGKFNSKMLSYRFLKNKRPKDGVFYANIGNLISLFFILKMDFIKDQYGESPTKNDYVCAPFEYFTKDLKRGKKVVALFIIDGGPRSDILKRILDMEEKNDKLFPIIYLCDANKKLYSEQIKRRPNGIYLRGTNKTLDDRILYGSNKKKSVEKTKYFYGREGVSLEKLLEKEVWYYNSAEQGC